MIIEIFQIDPAFNFTENQLKSIILSTCTEINLSAKSCTFVFVDDKTLAVMHGQYLKDASVTDVITYSLGNDDDIEGEIYISTERAQEQAKQFGVSYQEEITRLVIHGLLHLAGYDDIDENDHAKMKEVENMLVERFMRDPELS